MYLVEKKGMLSSLCAPLKLQMISWWCRWCEIPSNVCVGLHLQDHETLVKDGLDQILVHTTHLNQDIISTKF